MKHNASYNQAHNQSVCKQTQSVVFQPGQQSTDTTTISYHNIRVHTVISSHTCSKVKFQARCSSMRAYINKHQYYNLIVHKLNNAPHIRQQLRKHNHNQQLGYSTTTTPPHLCHNLENLLAQLAQSVNILVRSRYTLFMSCSIRTENQILCILDQ